MSRFIAIILDQCQSSCPICIDKTGEVAFFDAKLRDLFFKCGIYKLIERWKMIVKNGGECIID